jgi:hypothetical protein
MREIENARRIENWKEYVQGLNIDQKKRELSWLKYEIMCLEPYAFFFPQWATLFNWTKECFTRLTPEASAQEAWWQAMSRKDRREFLVGKCRLLEVFLPSISRDESIRDTKAYYSLTSSIMSTETKKTLVALSLLAVAGMGALASAQTTTPTTTPGTGGSTTTPTTPTPTPTPTTPTPSPTTPTPSPTTPTPTPTTPGLPNTGDGGNAATNILLLIASGSIAIAGLIAARKMRATA